MSKTENPPAFPFHGMKSSEATEGMSLRDYFADTAMEAIIRNMTSEDFAKVMTEICERDDLSMDDVISKKAYEQADAMLKERSKS